MKIIRNNIIPFRGFKAINICGILFVRKNADLKVVDIRHEQIHTKQMLEILIIGFYLWYLLEWCFKLLYYRNAGVAYRNISFEKEAYWNQYNKYYLSSRNHFTWLCYI